MPYKGIYSTVLYLYADSLKLSTKPLDNGRKGSMSENIKRIIYYALVTLILVGAISIVVMITNLSESQASETTITESTEPTLPIVINCAKPEPKAETLPNYWEEATVSEATPTEAETTAEQPKEKWIEYNDGNLCRISGYCLCRTCCGKNWQKNVTASGVEPQRYVTCANGSLPFGTKVYIEGFGYRIVQDRGSGVGKNHFDIYCGVQNHEVAKSVGWIKRKVWIIEEE